MSGVVRVSRSRDVAEPSGLLHDAMLSLLSYNVGALIIRVGF